MPCTDGRHWVAAANHPSLVKVPAAFVSCLVHRQHACSGRHTQSCLRRQYTARHAPASFGATRRAGGRTCPHAISHRPAPSWLQRTLTPYLWSEPHFRPWSPHGASRQGPSRCGPSGVDIRDPCRPRQAHARRGPARHGSGGASGGPCRTLPGALAPRASPAASCCPAGCCRPPSSVPHGQPRRARGAPPGHP